MKSLLVLALLVAAVSAQGGTDCTSVTGAGLAGCIVGPGNPGICAVGAFPNPSGSAKPCCPQFPTCRLNPAYNCTRDGVAQCVTQFAITGCAAGVTALAQNGSPCCPTCDPYVPTYPPCTTDPSALPVCTMGQLPVKSTTTGCPSCRPPSGISVPTSVCTPAVLLGCISAAAVAARPTCAPGVLPTRGSAMPDPTNPASVCCPTCEPRWLSACNASALIKCDIKLAASALSLVNGGTTPAPLPPCAGTAAAYSEPPFDPSSCCRSCVRPLPPPAQSPDPVSGACSAAAMSACRLASPVCRDFEDQQFSIAAGALKWCCPACRRPEELCRPEDVAACLLAQPLCPLGAAQPMHVSGDCCLACRPQRTPCSPACATGQLCYWPRIGGVVQTTAGVCLPTRFVTFVVSKTVSNRTAAISCTSIRLVVLEVIARFCSQARNRVRCSHWASHLQSLDIGSCADETPAGSITVTVTIPDTAADAADGHTPGDPTLGPQNVKPPKTGWTSPFASMVAAAAAAAADSGGGGSSGDTSSYVAAGAAADSDAASGYTVTVTSSSDSGAAFTIAPAQALAAVSLLTLLALL